jgi:hypothetical protein
MREELKGAGLCPECNLYLAKKRYKGLCGYCNKKWRIRRKYYMENLKDDEKKGTEKENQENQDATDEAGDDFRVVIDPDIMETVTEDSVESGEISIGGLIAPGVTHTDGRVYIVLDITNYEDNILPDLERAAIEDIRTVPEEGLFMIVKGLKERFNGQVMIKGRG